MRTVMNLIAVVLCSVISLAATAQNLVPNYSFEEPSTCPQGLSELNKAIPWFPASASPDFFHACSNSAPPPNYVGVPNNVFGSQSARTGVGYAGFYAFNTQNPASSTKKREYIETRLNDSLKKGVQYRVEFYVSLADSLKWATGSLGAYFSDTQIVKISTGYLTYTPQILNVRTNLLTNKNGWTLVSGIFTAKGRESYIIIGNFNTDSLSDTTYVGGFSNWGGWSYYYIDDVSVTPRFQSTGIVEAAKGSDYAHIYPNPFRNKVVLEFTNPGKEPFTLAIYDMSGRQVRMIRDIRTSSIELERGELANGLYFFRLQAAGNLIATGKLMLE